MSDDRAPGFSSGAGKSGVNPDRHSHGGPGLDGWREWLMKRYPVGRNLVWKTQIRQIALPDWERGRDLTPDEEARVLSVLFELFDTFLAEREASAEQRTEGGARVNRE